LVCEVFDPVVWIGPTVTNRKPKAASSRVHQWDEGVPLSFAWFGCASPEAKREYHACEIDSRRMSYRLQMQSQALDDVISGKLVAWGFRGGAPPEEGPMPIPAHLFPRDREDTADIDWLASSLRSSGHSFVRIRVAKPQIATLNKKRATVPKIKQTESPTTPPVTPVPTTVSPATRKQMGRPSVEKPLREVIRKLAEAGQLKGNSRKEQIARIQVAARAAHPDLFLRETQPSRDRIFSALRAEGLIGAKE
jgi:hypothetical protein